MDPPTCHKQLNVLMCQQAGAWSAVDQKSTLESRMMSRADNVCSPLWQHTCCPIIRTIEGCLPLQYRACSAPLPVRMRHLLRDDWSMSSATKIFQNLHFHSSAATSSGLLLPGFIRFNAALVPQTMIGLGSRDFLEKVMPPLPWPSCDPSED